MTKAGEEPGNKTSRLGSGLVGVSSGCGLGVYQWVWFRGVPSGCGYYLSESLEVEHQYVW